MSPSAASSLAKPLSFFSSSGWKRVFSRQRMSPSCMAATAACAFGPDAIFGERDRPLHDARDLGGDRPQRIFRIGSLLGRPKCDSRITLPPLSAISVMVGAISSMRVASATLPSCIGTLRSTRNEHALAPHVGVVEIAKGHGEKFGLKLAHRHRGVDHAVGEAPFVVVPGHHPHQGAVDDLGLVHMEHR